MEPSGVRPRQEHEPLDASELQEPLLVAVLAAVLRQPRKPTVEAAGYETGEGFIKLPYGRELPIELLKALMQARVEDYETTGA